MVAECIDGSGNVWFSKLADLGIVEYFQSMCSYTTIVATRELSLESIHSAMQSKCYPDHPASYLE